MKINMSLKNFSIGLKKCSINGLLFEKTSRLHECRRLFLLYIELASDTYSVTTIIYNTLIYK